MEIAKLSYESLELANLSSKLHDAAEYFCSCPAISNQVWDTFAPHERYDAIYDLEGRLAELQNRSPREFVFGSGEETNEPGKYQLSNDLLYNPVGWEDVVNSVMKTDNMGNLSESDKLLTDKLRGNILNGNIEQYKEPALTFSGSTTPLLEAYQEKLQQQRWDGFVTAEATDKELTRYSEEIGKLWGLPPTQVEVHNDPNSSPYHCVLGKVLYTHDDKIVMEHPFACEVAKRYGNATIFGSLAHEVCHGLHYLNKQGPVQELIADMGSAISMVKMGVNPLPRINAFLDPTFGYFRGSSVHPPGMERAYASMHAAEVALKNPDLSCMEILQKSYQEIFPNDDIKQYINQRNIDVYHTYEVFKPFFTHGMDDAIRLREQLIS